MASIRLSLAAVLRLLSSLLIDENDTKNGVTLSILYDVCIVATSGSGIDGEQIQLHHYFRKVALLLILLYM